MSLTVNNSESLSTLFSSLNNSSSSAGSGVSDLTGLLSEYNSIRNGSYAKLAKQYYGKDAGKDGTVNPIAKTDATEQFGVSDKLKISDNKELISDVASLRSSISEIKKDDTLFDKATIRDDAGSETTDYNYDKIYKKLESFVKNYNSVVDQGKESENSTVLRNVDSMTNAAAGYKKQLEAAGITINSDDTLSVSRDDMKSSLSKSENNAATVKNLFSATSSFMRQVDAASTNVASQAASDVYSLGGYTSTGAYKQTLESIYNTVI